MNCSICGRCVILDQVTETEDFKGLGGIVYAVIIWENTRSLEELR